MGTSWTTSLCRIDALIGYQFLRYDERLGIVETIVPTSGPFAAGTTLTSRDDFATMNIFNGLDLGFRAQFRYDAWSLELLGKVAAGSLNRTVSILGTQQTSVPGAATVASPGGLLALSSNIGTVATHTLTTAPEFGVKLGWDVTPNVRVFTGYIGLVVAERGAARRAGGLRNQPRPDSADGPAAGQPVAARFPRTNFQRLAQTLSFGLEVKY